MGFGKIDGEPVPASEFNSFLSSAGLYGASSAGSDDYAISVTPAPNDYDAGDKFTFKADVANTGPATLNVNGLGAKAIKKFGSLALATGDIAAGQVVTVKYDGVNFQMESAVRPVPFFQQEVPFDLLVSAVPTFGSSQDGSVIFTAEGGASDRMMRFERDPKTGMYFKTHQVNLTIQISGTGSENAIVVIGAYVYLLSANTNNLIGARFLAADLTGESNLTFNTAVTTNNVALVAWTDGTDIYLISGASGTTARRETISGLTLTQASTASVSINLITYGLCSMFDGSKPYVVGRYSPSSNFFRVMRLDAADGTSITYDDTKINASFNNSESSMVIAGIDDTKIYVGRKADKFNQTDADWSVFYLLPITKI